MFSLLTFLSTHSDYEEMNGTLQTLVFSGASRRE